MQIHFISDTTCIKLDCSLRICGPRSSSHHFTWSNRIMSNKVCKTYLEMVAAADDKNWCFFFFFKKMSHSAWQSSLIISVLDDGTSMKAAVNGKEGVACGSAADKKRGEKTNWWGCSPTHDIICWCRREDARWWLRASQQWPCFLSLAFTLQGLHVHLSPLCASFQGGCGVGVAGLAQTWLTQTHLTYDKSTTLKAPWPTHGESCDPDFWHWELLENVIKVGSKTQCCFVLGFSIFIWSNVNVM